MAGHCPYAHPLGNTENRHIPFRLPILLRARMPTTPRGPGPVAAVHRIFIVTALLCALAYAAWELREMARTGEPLASVRGALALLVAAGTGVYLRSLRGLGAKLTPRERGSTAAAFGRARQYLA